MIPKIIHYCWFGHNPLPKSARECIASWRKHLPDYEIKEWNEDNFDVNQIKYTCQAYEAKKYAFVSDYARFWVLYNYGGLYFDTDVEIIKPLDNIIARGAFMGVETPCGEEYNYPQVNPGLGLGVEAGHEFFKQVLARYAQLSFLKPDDQLNTTTVVQHTTELLMAGGLQPSNELQQVCGIWFYPRDFFCPLVYGNEATHFSDNTVTIHHFAGSWLPPIERFRKDHPRLMRYWHALRAALGFPVKK